MQNKTQRVKKIKHTVKSRKGQNCQSGGLFWRKKGSYNVVSKEENKNKPSVNLLSYKKITSPVMNHQEPKFSNKQLNDFEKLRAAALEARKANGSYKKKSPIYNQLGNNTNNNSGNNNGYGKVGNQKPDAPPRTYVNHTHRQGRESNF